MMTIRRSAGVCTLVAMLGACAELADNVEQVSSEVGVGCPELGCNLNAASLGDGLYFHELHPAGLPNSAGVRFVRFESSRGVPLTLQVFRDRLRGIDPNGVVYQGTGLVDARIHLARETERYVVRIADVDTDSVQFWVFPHAVPIYSFVYTKLSATDPEHRQEQPVCTTNDVEEAVPTTAAFVFIGDRYNAVNKTVTDVTGGWFNVACAGSAMAKLHLLRHTRAGELPPVYTTTVPQRQAMLKMLTADVCGTGLSFTVDGENVHYTDQRGWHPLPALTGTTESIWTENGAICLDEPRREREEGREVRDRIERECPGRRLPSCAAMESSWTSVGYGYTRNPLLTKPLPLSLP
jgi:hypothetical protein